MSTTNPGAAAPNDVRAQPAVATLNGFFNNGGALPPGFVTIFGLTGGNLANALSQLSGEAATGAQQVGFQLTDQFLNLMLDPFVDGRSGVGGASGPALGFAPERDAALPSEIALAYASVLKAPAMQAPIYEPRWTRVGRRLWRQQRTSGDLAVIGSHDLVGAHRGLRRRPRLSPHARHAWSASPSPAAAPIGASSQGLGGGKSDAFQAGVYGATRYGPAYLAAAFAFTNHWMSTDRFAFAGDHLTANFNAQSYGGRLEGGYRFATPYGGITPYAAIQAQSFHTPGYNETDVIGGGFALAYNSPRRAPTPGASSARASTGCWRSIPTPCWRCAARRRLGARLGERSDARTPCSRRFRARASSSTARRRRRTPRWPRPAPSFASPTASRCSPSSTASSPRTPRPTPAPAPCDTRGDRVSPMRDARSTSSVISSSDAKFPD